MTAHPSREAGKAMVRFLETMNRVAEILCAALMVLLSLETVYVIVMRYVFNNAPYWGEVISRFLMVYACMFGFSMGIHDDTLVRIHAFDRFLSKRARRLLDGFGVLCMAVFSIFMIVEGIRYTSLCRGNVISGLNIPSSWEMICIPIGGCFCLMQTIRRGIILRRDL